MAFAKKTTKILRITTLKGWSATLLRGVLQKRINEICKNKLPVMIALTSQELRIVRLIAQGAKTPDIAKELDLRPETVKWYRKRLLDKFQASTSAEVVRKALEENLI